MSEPKHPAPSLWKSSFMWFGVALAGLAAFAFVRGDEAIRDPGQVREGNLAWFYLAGAVIMLVNGVLSHRQAVKAHNERPAK